MNLKSFSTSYTWIILIILLLAAIISLVWINMQWVEILPQESQFFYNWQITRGFIFDQINPYEPVDGYNFKLPFPALLIFFPFALIENFGLAQAVWITALQLANIIFTYLCVQNTSWKISTWQTGMLVIFALLWYPSISIFTRGSEVAILGTFVLAALLALQKNQNEIAGILIAIAALELRITLLSVLLILLWITSQKKWLSFFWAGVFFLFSSGVGLIFLSSWPLDFFWATLRHTDFRIGQIIIATTTRWWPGIGTQVGWGIVIIAALLLIVEWWLVWGKGAKRLTWSLALTWIISIWIGYETNIDNVFLLLFPLIIIFAAWNRRWGRSGLFFSWGTMALLLPGLWWAYRYYEAQGIGEGLNPILTIGFPLLVLVGLYWVRWWYLRPEYLNLHEG